MPHEKGQWERPHQEGGKGLTKKATFEERLKEMRKEKPQSYLGKSIPSRRNSLCKVPEAGACLLWNSKETRVAEDSE